MGYLYSLVNSCSFFKKAIIPFGAFLLFFGSSELHATNFTVNNASDANTGSGTTGTLRYCITQANLTAGPHTITFSGVTSITFASDYPTFVRQISIDGGPSKVIIQCTAANACLRPFYLTTGASGSTLKNLDIRGGGCEPIRIDGNLSDITIQNMICSNTAGNYWNYGIFVTGNATNYTIDNFVMKDLEAGGWSGIHFAGTTDNVTINRLRIITGLNGGGFGLRFSGVATTIAITNCLIDLSSLANNDDGDRGVRFETNVSNLTMTNDTINRADIWGVEMLGTVTNATFTNVRYTAGSYGDARGMQFYGVSSGITINNCLMDMDVFTTPTPPGDDGNYGIYFNTNVSNLNINGLTMHDAEVYGIYVGGTLTGTNSITNSSLDNYDGDGASEMIRFQSTVTGLTMTNVNINCDYSASTNDSDFGVTFANDVSNSTLTNVSVREADNDGLRFWTDVTNVTVTGGQLIRNYDGIEFYNCNYNRKNVDLVNITIDSSDNYGICHPACTGGINDDIDITGCTISNSGADGIIIRYANVATDITISGCTIKKNGRTSTAGDGIQVNAPDNVVITQNSIYDNAGLGINHTAGGNCSMEGALAPVINSVTPLGGGQYQVNFTIPVAAGAGTYKAEFFTNNPIAGVEGEYYVHTVTGLSAGAGQVTTFTSNTGPAATPKTANLTMTYTRTGAACNGTSEFSNALALDPQGPGCVTNGIVGWYRADKITGYVNGAPMSELTDYSGTGNKFKQYVAAQQPLYFAGDVTTNFNPSITFDGSNDNFNITNGVLPTNTGGTLLSAQYHANIAGDWSRIYDQNQDDPSLIKVSGTGEIRFYDNGNLGQQFNTRLFVNNVSNIRGFDYGTTSGTTNVYFDGVSSANLGATPSPEAGLGMIGAWPAGPIQGWNGKIHELVFYSRELNATERQKINTYYSIKYGISIDTTIMKVPGAGNDYITGDGTVIWTANNQYYHRVTGIGRDDCDELVQKQSRNVNLLSPGYVTIGLGTIATTNATNPNNFASNKDFMVWADDGKAGASTTSIAGDGVITLSGGTCATYSRLKKTFKVQETGTVGAVRLEFNMTGVKLGKTAADYYLAINSTDIFTGTITQLVAPTSYDNVTGILVFNGVDFNTTTKQYFTVIGKKVYGPANITANLKLWLKAEDGIAANNGDPVDTWGDQGPAGNDVTQTTPANQPTYNSTSTLINFNPSVNFNGSTNRLIASTNFFSAGNVPYTNFGVVRETSLGAYNYWFWDGNGGCNQTIALGHSSANTMANVNYCNDLSLGAITSNRTYIELFTRNSVSFVRNNILDGKNVATSTVGGLNKVNNPNQSLIGADFNGNQQWSGQMGEIIAYQSELSATDQQKINSYLAIKWGISLDQTSPYDYLSADGTVIWDATTNATYKNRITGIGREDCSDVIQRQSWNQDTSSAYAIIGLGTIAATNLANTGSFANDKTFLIWGDDGVAGATATSVTGDGTITLTSNGCGVFRRLAKTFKRQKTGMVGTVQIKINLRGVTLGKVAADHYLAIHSSATFTGTIQKLVQASSYSNGVLTFNNVDLNSFGPYFTVIGQKASGPANITANLKLWLRAEDGITLNGSTVENWADQGPNGLDAGQATVANQPIFNGTTNLINFNPTVSFDGANDYLRTGANIYGTGNISYTTFGILDHNSVAGSDYILSDGVPGVTNQNVFFGHQGALQTQGNWNNDFQAGPVAINIPYLQGFIRDASTNVRTNYQSAKLMGTSAVLTAINKTNNGFAYVGATTNTANFWNGKIGEIITYQSVLSTPELQKVNSYLAVKWGFTLNQTTQPDYVSANGTTIWDGDATGYVAYKNRITGIGRDDCSDLQQKQSKSVETGSLVTVSNGTTLAVSNDLNTSTYSADNSWLLFGDNGRSLNWTGSGVPINGGNVRLNRVWRVKETGTVGTVYVEVPDNTSSQTYKLPATTNSIYLLIANSGTNGKFSALSGVTIKQMTYDATNKKWYTTYNFSDGDYFTFGSEKVCIAPVGISEGLTSWYHVTDLAVGPVPSTLADMAFGVYPLTKAGTADVVAGSATSFNYNRSMTLTAGSFSKSALTNTDVIDASAGSMLAVGTTNANLFAISSTGANSSGLLNPSAQFNGTNGTYNMGIAGKPNIFTMLGSTANVKAYTNGTAGVTSGSIAARAAGTYVLGLGKNGSNASSYTGSIAEAMSFDRVLDPEEKDILESYLAIKYGQTLSHNYYNADYDGSNAGTTTVYDVSTYPNRVFGIGTDTTGCFYQKQSTSALSGSMLKMSLGNAFAAENSGNTANFTIDRSYVMAGDDNGSIAAWVTGGGANPNTPAIYQTTCVYPTRINRQWKVTGTYATPSVLFAIPDATSGEATTLPSVTAGYSVWMVINGDADFGVSASQTEVAMTLNATTKNWEGQYQIPAGATKYITFVMKNNNIPTGATPPDIAIVETDNSCTPNDGGIVSGASALLTPTVGTAYLWSTGATSSTLTVTPTMTTTYTVTVTASNGCTNTASSTVTVGAAPVPVITETDNSCAFNDNQVLSGATVSLVASGGNTYLWENASNIPSRTVNPTVTTTYTVTVTDLSGCTASLARTITIVTLPTVSLVGAASICIGDMTSVSPTTGGTWASSDPVKASVTNAGSVTGLSAGSVQFTFTATSTGCSASPPTVTVNPTPAVSITGSNNICIGSTTTLSPSAGGTWVSNSPAVATVDNSGVVTGVSAGSATFTFTNSTTGCVSAPTSALTVNSLPVVSITGSSSICVGLTTTLSPTSGGTWVSSNPSVASVTNAGVVTGVSEGTVTFTYTKNAAPNCSATTATVTVNALPIVSITGDNVICVSETTTLSPVSGGTWASSAPGVATVTNAGVVTGVSAGSAMFTFTSTATGCLANTAPVTVDPLPAVSITGANSICVGFTTALSPTTGGTWASSAPGIATVTNAGVVTAVAPGSATFTFTSTATGCTSLPTSAVSVTALPVVSITGQSTICVGSTTTLSPTSGGSWVSNNPSLASVTNAGVVTGLAAGSATFTFTSSTSPNCSNTTVAVTLLAQPSVSITGASTICAGATTTLSPTTGGTWASSNPAVATVSNTGVVTGVSAGSATFTFTESSTGCVSLATSAVTVNALPVVSITGNSSICVGFTTTLSPTTGGSWASSNPAVATVTNAGVVMGVSAGTATFTFTNSTTGCASAPTSAVTVNATPVVAISGSTSICIGANSGLTPTSGGTWTSSAPSVATVTNAGVVTGVSAGTATFTFTQTGTGCVSAPTPAITVNSSPTATITGASSICIGGTTTLSPTGGTWTSSNPSVATVTNAGVVTGIAAGTATFTFTNGTTGCQSTASAPVTVNAPPTVGITGPSSICVGTTTVLSPTSGGTWVSSDPSVATVTNAGLVTGVSAGLATFTFTSTATGCVSAPTSPVTVNPLPVVSISGPSSICAGFTTGLSPSTGGTWASSNAAVATVTNSGVVTGVAAGTATFTFTNTTTGCVSAPTSAVTVYANPVVSITGSNSICAGATTTLSPSSGGTWVSTNTGVATVTNAGVVTGVSAGTSTFIFTSSSTGCVSAPTAVVTVNAIPIVSVTGPSNICIGATTGLTPTSGGNWVSSNPAVATVTNAGVVTGVSAGSVTFTFTDGTTGCVSAPTSAVTVNPSPVVSITGGNTICVGSTTTLSPTSGGTWVSSAPAVATVTSAGIVTGVSGGSATFTFTNTATGCVSAATAPVTVNPLPVVSITGSNSICVGGSTTLSPTSGGTWASSNPGFATVTNTGVVTGIAAGTVNFTFTNSITGCVSPATPTVTVNPLPVVSITGSNSLCVGGTTTVAPTTGGTWTSNNPGVATVTNAGLVTAVSAGTATFVFTNSTTGCISAPTSAVTVNATPVVFITGSSSICIGATTTLSPTSGGTWASSNPAVATVTNAGVVTGVTAGTATFTFTNTTTGCVSAPTSAITVNGPPVASITGPTSICVGATSTLAPTTGGTWSSSNPAVATVTNAGVVTGVSGGTATFTFTNSITGCSSAATAALTVNGKPIVSITGANNICAGASTTLSPSSGGTWSSSNPAVATVTNAGVVTGVAAGTATFTFTLTSTGCVSLPTSPVTVSALPTAIITGSSNVCIGATTTLSPTSGGTWSSSNPAVATVTNGGLVTAVAAGTATFTFTSSTTGCSSLPSAAVTVAACNSLVAARTFLGGPYDPGVDLMKDDLRTSNLIPTAQPYGGPAYTDFNYTGTETIGAGVLAVTGVNAIVDWVLLELRSASNPATVISRKAALIQRDGDVVEASDGVSPVTFVGAPAGNYYVAVRHRNHLGVMTSGAIALSGTSGTPINFTSAATNNYQLGGASGSTHAQRTLANGKRALWEGNMSNIAGSGNQIQYQGNNSDSDEPYFKVLLDPGNVTVIPNYIVIAYDRADGNLDGKVIYQGSDSDSDIPFFEVYTFPDNVLFLPNYIIFEQIP